MEQTLGKRIAENRKRLKLTQDQLAERLGLTAQAVSKWENDLSCPDITMLPKLAEIFGITTDELLGIEQSQKVYNAEIVQDGDADSGIFNFSLDSKDDGGKWAFHWDSGKGGAIAFAVMVLTVGLLTLASRMLNWNITFWEILWPCALITFGITHIVEEFSIFHLSVLLFGGYSLVNNLGFVHLGYDGNLFFPLLIILFGLSLLTDALKKPKKSRFWVKKNGETVFSDHKRAPTTHLSTGEESFECESAFGDYSQLVTLPRLARGEIECSFGDLTVDLSGCETVAEHCRLDADCSFGQLTLIVPKQFHIVPDTDSAFGELVVEGEPDPQPSGTIRLDADVSFGSIRVRYI